jgi:hypothetical protein
MKNLLRRLSRNRFSQNQRAVALKYTRKFGKRQNEQVDYRLHMAKLIADTERIDESKYTRSEQINHVLRTGDTLAVFDWECPQNCGFAHGNYTEKTASYLHNAPTCSCGITMRPVSEVMPGKQASRVWRKRNWGSEDATSPAGKLYVLR